MLAPSRRPRNSLTYELSILGVIIVKDVDSFLANLTFSNQVGYKNYTFIKNSAKQIT